MNWTTQIEELPENRGLKGAILGPAGPLSFADVLGLWQADAEFCSFFTAALAGVPYVAYRWETPALAASSAGRPFEFVILDSPTLARDVEPLAFAEHFRNDADVVAFSNLRGDATLIVPCPRTVESAYGHLAAFLRQAPEEQRHALWRLTGEVLARQLEPTGVGKALATAAHWVGLRPVRPGGPVWLSTAGAGVSWLHVRVDARPKYYGYRPYTVA